MNLDNMSKPMQAVFAVLFLIGMVLVISLMWSYSS